VEEVEVFWRAVTLRLWSSLSNML